MIEINVDRDYGPDETFELETLAEAAKFCRELAGDADTRRLWISVDGVVEYEWSASSGGRLP